MSLEKELANTLKAIRGLKAVRPDYLEDYFHDAIVKTLEDGKPLEGNIGYLYRHVHWRVVWKREGREDLSLVEDMIPDSGVEDLDRKHDVAMALKELTPKQQEYIYLYFWEGYTLEEIAELRRGSYTGTRQIIERALHTLGRALTRKGTV